MYPKRHTPSSHRASQTGGIVILVVLSLLVLLTVAAMGMSRNSLREVMIVGSSRQAASVRQLADTGLEFSLLWSDPQNKTSSTGAESFQSQMRFLLENPEKQGEYLDIANGPDMVLDNGDVKQTFEIKLLRLGKLPLMNTSVPDERLYNDIWVTRSAGLMKVGSLTYQHNKELWLTTPAQTN